MIWLIAKKEIYDNWQSHKITLAFALCLILLPMSFWLGLQSFSARVSSYNLTHMDDTLFAEHLSTYVLVDEAGKVMDSFNVQDHIDVIGTYRRPTPLGIFARGLEDRMNRPVQWFNLSKFGMQAEKDTGNLQERNKLFALFSPPDFLFVTKVVLSLLAIVFTFGAIAEERERGTLKLIISNPVSRGQVLFGKFLGGYLSFIGPYLAAMAIASLLITTSPLIAFNGESFVRILLILLISLGYVALFFFVGLLISALTRHAETAVLILLIIWTIGTFVISSVSGLVANQLVKIPSQKQIDTEKFKRAREIEDEVEQVNPSNSFIAGYGKWHRKAQPTIAEALQEIEERYAILRQKRLVLSQVLTRLSPVSAYIYATTGLAQTGIADETRYHQQLNRHQSTLRLGFKKWLETLMGTRPESRPAIYTQTPPHNPHLYRNWLMKIEEYEMGLMRNLFGSQLGFPFEKLSLSDTLRAIWPDLLLLVLWIGVAFASAILVLMKCEIQS